MYDDNHSENIEDSLNEENNNLNPLINLDLSLNNGKKASLSIYKGDNIRIKVNEFCKNHRISPKDEKVLIKRIRKELGITNSKNNFINQDDNQQTLPINKTIKESNIMQNNPQKFIDYIAKEKNKLDHIFNESESFSVNESQKRSNNNYESLIKEYKGDGIDKIYVDSESSDNKDNSNQRNSAINSKYNNSNTDNKNNNPNNNIKINNKIDNKNITNNNNYNTNVIQSPYKVINNNLLNQNKSNNLNSLNNIENGVKNNNNINNHNVNNKILTNAQLQAIYQIKNQKSNNYYTNINNTSHIPNNPNNLYNGNNLLLNKVNNLYNNNLNHININNNINDFHINRQSNKFNSDYYTKNNNEIIYNNQGYNLKNIFQNLNQNNVALGLINNKKKEPSYINYNTNQNQIQSNPINSIITPKIQFVNIKNNNNIVKKIPQPIPYNIVQNENNNIINEIKNGKESIIYNYQQNEINNQYNNNLNNKHESIIYNIESNKINQNGSNLLNFNQNDIKNEFNNFNNNQIEYIVLDNNLYNKNNKNNIIVTDLNNNKNGTYINYNNANIQEKIIINDQTKQNLNSNDKINNELNEYNNYDILNNQFIEINNNNIKKEIVQFNKEESINNSILKYHTNNQNNQLQIYENIQQNDGTNINPNYLNHQITDYSFKDNSNSQKAEYANYDIGKNNNNLQYLIKDNKKMEKINNNIDNNIQYINNYEMNKNIIENNIFVNNKKRIDNVNLNNNNIIIPKNNQDLNNNTNIKNNQNIIYNNIKDNNINKNLNLNNNKEIENNKNQIQINNENNTFIKNINQKKEIYSPIIHKNNLNNNYKSNINNNIIPKEIEKNNSQSPNINELNEKIYENYNTKTENLDSPSWQKSIISNFNKNESIYNSNLIKEEYSCEIKSTEKKDKISMQKESINYINNQNNDINEEKEPQDNNKKKRLKKYELPRDSDEINYKESQTQYDNISSTSKKNINNTSHESNNIIIKESSNENSFSKNNYNKNIKKINNIKKRKNNKIINEDELNNSLSNSNNKNYDIKDLLDNTNNKNKNEHNNKNSNINNNYNTIDFSENDDIDDSSIRNEKVINNLDKELVVNRPNYKKKEKIESLSFLQSKLTKNNKINNNNKIDREKIEDNHQKIYSKIKPMKVLTFQINEFKNNNIDKKSNSSDTNQTRYKINNKNKFVGIRLYEQYMDKLSKNKQLEEEKSKEIISIPAINKNSRRIIERLRKIGDNKTEKRLINNRYNKNQKHFIDNADNDFRNKTKSPFRPKGNSKTKSIDNKNKKSTNNNTKNLKNRVIYKVFDLEKEFGKSNRSISNEDTNKNSFINFEESRDNSNIINNYETHNKSLFINQKYDKYTLSDENKTPKKQLNIDSESINKELYNSKVEKKDSKQTKNFENYTKEALLTDHNNINTHMKTKTNLNNMKKKKLFNDDRRAVTPIRQNNYNTFDYLVYETEKEKKNKKRNNLNIKRNYPLKSQISLNKYFKYSKKEKDFVYRISKTKTLNSSNNNQKNIYIPREQNNKKTFRQKISRGKDINIDKTTYVGKINLQRIKTEGEKEKKNFNQKSSDNGMTSKYKKYRELFDLLDSRKNGYISNTQIKLSKIDENILKIISPILEELNQTKKQMDFKEFCVKVDKLITEKRVV